MKHGVPNESVLKDDILTIFLYISAFLRGYDKLLYDNEEKPNHSNRDMSKSVSLRGKGLFDIFYSLIILKQLLS
jgi:hypothetical protein